MLNLKEKYRSDLLKKKIIFDSSQEMVINQLQILFDNINNKKKKKNIFYQIKEKIKKIFNTKKNKKEKGIYLWGKVGRGKTYLTDLFYDSLTIKNKSRLHFHRFMKKIHSELTSLSGEKNPLKKIAKNLSKNNEVICLDELYVSDITDAMILVRLLKQIFEEEIILIINSNIDPPNLYKNGLQRQHFIPAINLIEENLKIIYMTNEIDYRLKTLSENDIFYISNNIKTIKSINNMFIKMATKKPIKNYKITISNRYIKTKKISHNIVWFSFEELCNTPRSQIDYIEITNNFHTIFLTNVPLLNDKYIDQVRRFIMLIDEVYDRKVKLIMSSEVEIKNLYKGTKFIFEFQRTYSRLYEMKSIKYLKLDHKI